jgi:hypothetical protein
MNRLRNEGNSSKAPELPGSSASEAPEASGALPPGLKRPSQRKTVCPRPGYGTFTVTKLLLL